MRSVIEASVPGRRSRPREHQKAPAARNAAEARARLEAILSRRRFVPSPDQAYTIPFEQLRLEQRKAYGPSLVEGDGEVAFWYFERAPDGRFVASYGMHGSMAGRDMPLASRQLFLEVMDLLKHLPGYSEICEFSGSPLRQPLAMIAYKLLRGLATIDRVRFRRFTTEAAKQLQASRAREQVSAERPLLRVSPREIAHALLEQGASVDSARRVVETLWTGSDRRDVGRLVDRTRLANGGTRIAVSRLIAASPLARYAHAVRRAEGRTQ